MPAVSGLRTAGNVTSSRLERPDDVIDADDFVVGCEAFGSKTVEDDPAAGLGEILHFFQVGGEFFKISRRGIDHRNRLDPSGDRGQWIRSGIVIQADRVDRFGKLRAGRGYDRRRTECLFITRAVFQKIEKQHLRRRFTREFFLDRHLAEQKQALVGGHFDQSGIAQKIAALDQGFSATRRLQIGIAEDDFVLAPREKVIRLQSRERGMIGILDERRAPLVALRLNLGGKGLIFQRLLLLEHNHRSPRRRPRGKLR